MDRALGANWGPQGLELAWEDWGSLGKDRDCLMCDIELIPSKGLV